MIANLATATARSPVRRRRTPRTSRGRCRPPTRRGRAGIVRMRSNGFAALRRPRPRLTETTAHSSSQRRRRTWRPSWRSPSRCHHRHPLCRALAPRLSHPFLRLCPYHAMCRSRLIPCLPGQSRFCGTPSPRLARAQGHRQFRRIALRTVLPLERVRRLPRPFRLSFPEAMNRARGASRRPL
jgi:hypothetical protein